MGLYKNNVTKTLMIDSKEVAPGETVEVDEARCKACPYIRLGYLVPVEKTEAKPKKKTKKEEPKEEPQEKINTEVD